MSELVIEISRSVTRVGGMQLVKQDLAFFFSNPDTVWLGRG